MGFRQSVADFILGGELGRIRQGFDIMEDAYRRGPYIITPDQLAVSLRETDSTQLWDLIRRLQNYDVVWGTNLTGDDERLRAVTESRILWKWDVVAQQIIWLWTNFGFGMTISLTPEDDELAEYWDAFWNSDENENIFADDNIAALSDLLLVDGEYLMVFFISELGGPPTVRLVKTDEIKKIITNPDDSLEPLFYQRDYKDAAGNVNTVYYPDYVAYMTKAIDLYDVLPKGAVRADKQKAQTVVVAMPMAYNRKGDLRGWPIYSAGAIWSKEHTRFRENRASVSAAVAMYVNKLKADGGQRVVDALKTKLGSTLANMGTTGAGYDTNPPAVVGSTFISNRAVDLERMPLGTGASDAKEDGNALLIMAAMGGGVFPHYLGNGDAYRLATSVAMEAPLFRQWSRYQQFWGSKLRRMLRIVAWAAEQYEGAHFETLDCTVSTDRLIDDDLTAVTGALGTILRDGLAPYLNLLPDEMVLSMLKVVWTNVLGALGEADVAEVLKPEWFEPEPEGEQPVVPVVPVNVPPGGNGNGSEPSPEGVPAELGESHEPIEVAIKCPLCKGDKAYAYPDHKGLLVCVSCKKTFDPQVEH